jgi:hypothetical protein
VEVEGDRPVASAVFSGTPEVKGMSLTELAPEKAASWVLAVGLAVAEGLSGLRTLDMLALDLFAMDVDLPVNDMDNTVGDEHVGDNDLGLVDVDSAVVNLDVDLLASSSVERTVLKVGAVGNSVVDNMVLEDVHEIRLAHVGENGANIGKGAVAGRKDGNVPGAGEVGDQVGLGESTSNGGEVGSNGSVGEVLGDGENTVDDVDDTTSEVEILDS